MDLKYKRLIFDFHGTMTDQQLRLICAYHRAGERVLKRKFNREFYQSALERRPHHENGQGETHQEFIQRLFGHIYNAETIRKLTQEFHREMQSLYIPIPDIGNVTRAFLKKGVKIAVLTNGFERDAIERNLKNWRLPELADNLFLAADVGAKKPDPAGILWVMSTMDGKYGVTEGQRTLLVGNDFADCGAAVQAGVDSALLVRVYTKEELNLLEPRPTYVISEPRELVQIVEGRRGVEDRETVPLSRSLWTRGSKEQ